MHTLEHHYVSKEKKKLVQAIDYHEKILGRFYRELMSIEKRLDLCVNKETNTAQSVK